MAHQIILTDEDYATLEAVSARTGASVDDLVRRAIAECFIASPPAPPRVTYSYPKGKRPSRAERDEMERLAEKIGPQKPWLTDMIIEDRGPRFE